MRRIPIALVLTLSATATAQAFPEIEHPVENPFAVNKAMLGKVLFWDEQLSSSGTVACGTCHRPAAGGSDPRTLDSAHPGADGVYGTEDDIRGATGVVAETTSGQYVGTDDFGVHQQVTHRLSPSFINAAVFTRQLWDGAVDDVLVDPLTGLIEIPAGASLEAQALGPPVNSVEMGHIDIDWAEVAARIANWRPLSLASDLPGDLEAWLGDRSYRDVFAEVFGTPEVTPVRIAKAIATYERTLISNQSPFDRMLEFGEPMGALETQGWGVFFASNCIGCHNLVDFNQTFARTGVRPASEDPGLGGVTGQPNHMGAFKSPLLRNLGLRPAFFHNGGARTLTDVVEFYDRGGDFNPGGGFFQPLGLTAEEKTALAAFLQNGLTDPRVENELPPFDRPTLFTERAAASETIGHGTQGTFGIVPQLIAVEPAVLGHPDFTIGLGDAAGGMPAVLLLDTQAGDGSVSFQGVPLFVGASPALQVLNLGTLHGQLWGEGHGSWTIPIPALPGLAGASLVFQGLVADFGTPSGVAGTAAKRIEFFAPRGD